MNFLERILTQKKIEIEHLPESVSIDYDRPVRSFYKNVLEHPEKMHVIGEVKRASPSKGIINESVDIAAQAKIYEEAGVSVISVLTDATFFKGSFEDLRIIRKQVDVPLLCKDFILSKRQILQAKSVGADMILLIVAALSDEQLAELSAFASEEGLEVLVEVHNEDELVRARKISPKIIGINNRDLTTFQVDLAVSERLAQSRSTTVFISESGFFNAKDVQRVTSNYQGILVGESLMKSDNPKEKIRELRVSRL